MFYIYNSYVNSEKALKASFSDCIMVDWYSKEGDLNQLSYCELGHVQPTSFPAYSDGKVIVNKVTSFTDADDRYHELLRAKIISGINAKTETLIDDGTTYESVKFHCDAIAQRNFIGLLLRVNDLTYPYEVWDGDDSVEMTDATEMTAFLVAMFTFIETKRVEGKTLRESVAVMTNAELDSFTDSRS